jgi:cholecystokinin-like receptor
MVTDIRSHVNPEVAAARQRSSISMSFVVVLEFYICWTPIYTINTIAIYSPNFIYKGLGYNGIFILPSVGLFSSFTNPIIHCLEL